MKKSKLLALSLIGLSAISLASCGPKTGPVDPTKYTYELTIEPNKSFLKSEKRSVKKLANGNVREIIDYEFIVPEKEVAEVTNYNDLLIGANPLLLTPIAIEMNEDTVVRTLTAEETKSEFNPITEFSKSGYGDANIDSSLYNTEQLRTCYSISQSESGTLQSKYYNVSIVIEDNEAPVLNQAGVAELPFTLDIDSIKSSLKETILSSLTDNNSDTTLTVTLKDDPILTGLTNLNKEQIIHFDATDSDGNKIESQEFKYKLVDNLNYFETIDQEIVNTVSYKNAQANYIAQNYELYKGIYSYKILNEDELVFSNENADNIDEIKAVINKEQTIKYGIYEDNQLIGEFNYKFKMIDDVAPELYLKGSDELAWDTLNNGYSNPVSEYFHGKIENIDWVINWFNKYFEWRDDLGIKEYYFYFCPNVNPEYQECHFSSIDNNNNEVQYTIYCSNIYFEVGWITYSKVQDGFYDSKGNLIY